MKEIEDLLKAKALCEKILLKQPDNVAIKEKLNTINQKLRLISKNLNIKEDDKLKTKHKADYI
jgi:hypothetical protein